MRRILFTMALAIALVFAFSGVAVAKYAGYAYNNPVVGFVSGSSGATQTVDNQSPGYLSWQGANAISANYNGGTSTNGATVHGGYAVNTTKCAVCHSAHRANSDATAAGVGSYWKLTPGGQACVACHTPSGANPVSTALVEWPSTYTDGGPHSSFNCLSACHGSVHGAATSTYGAVRAFNLTARNDAAIAAAVAAGNVMTSTVDAATLAGNFDLLAASQKAANRAMITGYTCGASGCHSSSQFAVNQHGYAEARASKPASSTTLDKFMTGHITAGATHCSTGGCHSAIGNASDSKCASCHDMVGKATNSSAFPHANRNITVWEWTRPTGALEQTEKEVESGNLWMYGGDVTYRDGSSQPTATVLWSGQSGAGITHGALVGGLAPNRVNTRTVIEDAAGFHDGHAGNINDGTCLKCHGYKYWPLWDTTHSDNSFANR